MLLTRMFQHVFQDTGDSTCHSIPEQSKNGNHNDCLYSEKKDKIVMKPWVFVDIFEDQTVQELHDSLIRNGKFPLVKFTKQTCKN